MDELLRFAIDYWQLILELAWQHVLLTWSALAIAMALGIATAIIATRSKRFGAVLLAGANIAQAVPSIAVLGLVVPILGIGFTPAVFALVLRAILPIFLNTYLGIRGVERAITEAARGVGMRDWEILAMVELPLAAPIMIAGIRTAAVEGVAIATLAAFIGAGGLGDLILQGIALLDAPRLLSGAIPAALLAISMELLFGALEAWTVSRIRRRPWAKKSVVGR